MSDPITPDPAAAKSPQPMVVEPVTPEAAALQPNIAAALACFFSILGGLVFLALEKKNKFVRFYAMQSVLLGAASIVVTIGLAIGGAIIIHIPFIGHVLAFLLSLVSLVVSLAILAVSIITIVKAFTGKEWEIPYLGPIARKQLISGPLSKF